MALAPPPIADLFADASSSAERTERFDQYREKLNKSFDTTDRGGIRYVPGGDEDSRRMIHKVDTPITQPEGAVADPFIAKSMSPDVMTSIREELERQKAVEADIVKDLTLTSPLSTGFVAYDLEAPAKVLVPRLTPL